MHWKLNLHSTILQDKLSVFDICYFPNSLVGAYCHNCSKFMFKANEWQNKCFQVLMAMHFLQAALLTSSKFLILLTWSGQCDISKCSQCRQIGHEHATFDGRGMEHMRFMLSLSTIPRILVLLLFFVYLWLFAEYMKNMCTYSVNYNKRLFMTGNYLQGV